MSAEGKTSVVQAQVQVPTVEAVKEQLNPLSSDIPIIQTLAHGEVPSNKDLNDAINRTKDTIQATREEANLNLHGERLAKDATDILGAAQKFINEKNRDEQIQHLIQHSKEASDATAKQASNASYSLSRFSHLLFSELGFNFPTEQAKSDAQDAYHYGRELVLFAIRSKEFRSLLLDFINFFQSSLNNANEQLQQIGDSLKTDVKNADTNLSSASGAVQQTKEQAKDAAESKVQEWNEQTSKEYYAKFQRLLNRISEKPEYKRLLDLYWKWMDDLKVRAQEWTETLKVKAQEAAEQAKNVASDVANKAANDRALNSSFDKIWADVRDICDEFAGKGSFDALYGQMWELYYDVINDPAANAYFDKLRKFIVDAVNDPASLNTQAKQKEGEQLLRDGNNLMYSQKYKAKYNQVVSRANAFLTRVSNDKTTNELGDKIRRFGEDFALDSQGRPDLYIIQDSLSQVKNLVYPLLSKQLGNLSVAKIAGTNDTMDWSVEQLVVAVPNLIPEHFQIRTKNILDINLKDLETEKNNTKVVLELKNLRPCFKDLKFWYQRKTFPRIEDYGIADVDLSKGDGAKIKIIWKIKSKQNRPFAFSLMEVKCVIDSLDVTVRDAKHEFLDRIATTLFAANFKQALAAGIVNNIVDSLQPLNDQMNQWFATRPAVSLYEKANESLHTAFDATNKAIKDRPVERVMEKVKETYEYVKDNAGQTIESAKEAITEKASEVKAYVNEKVPELEGKAENLMKATTEKAQELKAIATEKVTEVKQEIKQESNAWTHSWTKSEKRRAKKVAAAQAQLNEKEYPPLSNDFEVLSNVESK